MSPEEREAVSAALVTALTCSAGFEISIYDHLEVRPLEDGRFALSVGREDTTYHSHPLETIFATAEEAVARFLDLREAKGLGNDYEHPGAQDEEDCDYQGSHSTGPSRRPMPYDPAFGDDRECECGHPYYRHFDSYDNDAPIGCKYCVCFKWREPTAPVQSKGVRVKREE